MCLTVFINDAYTKPFLMHEHGVKADCTGIILCSIPPEMATFSMLYTLEQEIQNKLGAHCLAKALKVCLMSDLSWTRRRSADSNAITALRWAVGSLQGCLQSRMWIGASLMHNFWLGLEYLIRIALPFDCSGRRNGKSKGPRGALGNQNICPGSLSFSFGGKLLSKSSKSSGFSWAMKYGLGVW